MPYPSAEHIARGVVLRLIGPEHLDDRVAAALLAELAARAHRLSDAAAERAALVRELAVVYDERDAALLRLGVVDRPEPNPTPRTRSV